MSSAVRLAYRAKPGVFAFVSRAFRRKTPGAEQGPLPEIVAEWRGQRSSRAEQADFLALSGIAADSELSILYPHTASFPLLMAILSHPVFPLPIWGLLQVRNHLTLHEAIAPESHLDFTVRTGDRRVLEKGIEMDLHVAAQTAGRTVFEGTNTFYSRGRFALHVDGDKRPAIVGRFSHPNSRKEMQ